MSKLLVVVDVQNDFVTGSLGTKEAEAIVPNVVAKVQEYLDNGDKVVFTRDTHKSNYLETQEGKNLPVEHCIKHTWGWQIVDELLDVVGFDLSVDVYSKKTFGSWELCDDNFHSNYDEIELVGLCTDICVISNALGLKAQQENGYAIISVDAACCAGVTPEAHDHALAVMKSCQIKVYNEGKEPWRE